jgi:hypothetical protein
VVYLGIYFPSVIFQMLVFSQVVVVVGVVVLLFSFELLSGRTKRCKKGFALLTKAINCGTVFL